MGLRKPSGSQVITQRSAIKHCAAWLWALALQPNNTAGVNEKRGHMKFLFFRECGVVSTLIKRAMCTQNRQNTYPGGPEVMY